MKNKYSKKIHQLIILFLISLLLFSCSDSASDDAASPTPDGAPSYDEYTNNDAISGDTISDTILIIGILPVSELIDNTESTFLVIVEYKLVTAESGELNIGFNTDNTFIYTIIEDASVEITSGHGYHFFYVTVTVKDWGEEGPFTVYVGLAQTVVSDEASLPLASDYSSNFTFE